MPDGPSLPLYDRLVQALRKAPQVDDVLLVARLDDPRVGFDNPKEVRVFIPDLHLLTKKDEKRYSYGFNCRDQLVGVLKALKAFRKGLAADERLTVYQLGDFVDLWRQGSDDATRILTEHYDIYGQLSAGPAGLDTWFVLGNHDIELPNRGGFGVWNRRYYFPIRDPRILVLHGDIFDIIEGMPDWFQSLFVYMFGPMYDGNAYDLKNLQAAVRQAHGRKQYKRFVQAECHDLADAVSATDGPGATRVNVTAVGDLASEEAHEFLAAAYRCLQEVRREFGLTLTTVVMGHTHRARINVYEGSGGEFLTLMDCGAWIERYRTPADPEPHPNAQIGVMVGNDCRIFQIVGGS